MNHKSKDSFSFSDLFAFFKSRLFRYTLLRMFVFLIILWTLTSFGLKIYTNHGQRVKLSSFTGVKIEKVEKLAYAQGFEIVIADSIHLSGVEGGVVQSQVPPAGSLVKRGRKIYLTTSRYNPDKVDSEVLFSSYGKKYEHKKAELYNLYALKSKLIAAEYDPGPPGHILKIYYKGELVVDKNVQKAGIQIAKGDTLDMIVSSLSGGSIDIPDLVCKDYTEVLFILDAAGLKIGEVNHLEDDVFLDSAIVTSQTPAFHPGQQIKMGEKINISISNARPENCD
ncbi:MAG: PASTA domain-containing protein [Saprospiraceae bacterium]|nr:PASTA domain-containing protein [Saprospiraceae bacterium]